MISIIKRKCLNTRGGCNNEAAELTFDGKKCCNFCSDNCRRLYRGEKKPEIPVRKIFSNTKRQREHDLYIWALDGLKPEWVEQKTRVPKPDEWIVTLKPYSTYVWDDFQKKYVRCIPGIGFFDDFGDLIVDAISDYYNRVMDRVKEVQRDPELLHKNDFVKPEIKRGVKKGVKRGTYKKRKKRVLKEIKTKKCIVCKGEFIQKNIRKIYCRSACRQKSYRWRKTKREIERLNHELHT